MNITRIALRTAAAFLVTGAVALGGAGTAGAATLAPPPSDATATSPAAEVTAPASQQSGSYFVDPAGRFTLVPPQGWTVDTSGAYGTEVIFADPNGASINVIASSSSADLSTTVVSGRQVLQEQLTNYQATVDEPVTLADGTPAHLLGGMFYDPASGLTLRNLQLITVHDGATVVVTGSAVQEMWDWYEPVLLTSLGSLTVA
jgi:hypothetical protein